MSDRQASGRKPLDYGFERAARRRCGIELVPARISAARNFLDDREHCIKVIASSYGARFQIRYHHETKTRVGDGSSDPMQRNTRAAARS